EAPVGLDQNEAATLAGEVFSQGAHAGADLDDTVLGSHLQLGGDPRGEGRVHEEALTQLATGLELESPQMALQFGEIHGPKMRASPLKSTIRLANASSTDLSITRRPGPGR